MKTTDIIIANSRTRINLMFYNNNRKMKTQPTFLSPPVRMECPKRVFVPMCCFTCGSENFETMNIETYSTPQYIYNVCADNECRSRAREAIKNFLYSQFCMLRYKMDGTVSVKRSTGLIDTEWKVHALYLSPENVSSVYLRKGDLSKDVTYEDFAALNPSAVPVVIAVAQRFREYYLNLL
jgi:hypothetical protein